MTLSRAKTNSLGRLINNTTTVQFTYIPEAATFIKIDIFSIATS